MACRLLDNARGLRLGVPDSFSGIFYLEEIGDAGRVGSVYWYVFNKIALIQKSHTVTGFTCSFENLSVRTALGKEEIHSKSSL